MAHDYQHPKEGDLIKGPVTFELTDEEIRAIKGGTKTISPRHIVGGPEGFAIRNHTFSGDKVVINLEKAKA